MVLDRLADAGCFAELSKAAWIEIAREIRDLAIPDESLGSPSVDLNLDSLREFTVDFADEAARVANSGNPFGVFLASKPRCFRDKEKRLWVRVPELQAWLKERGLEKSDSEIQARLLELGFEPKQASVRIKEPAPSGLVAGKTVNYRCWRSQLGWFA